MKKKNILSACLALLLVGGLGTALAAGSFGVISVPYPGTWTPTGIGAAKIAQVQVTGSAIAAGTVVLSRVSADHSVTQQLVSVTCSNGAVTYDETNAVFIVNGDLLLRTGTSTNGACRVIVQQ